MVGRDDLTYDDAKALAASGDPDQRRELAARKDLAPEILYFLAEDEAAAVRLAVAGNESAPAQSGLLLAEDPDDEVRRTLAEKVARLKPDFDPLSRRKLETHVVETLERLARDQASLVRRTLAGALKDLTNAPPQVIRQLAEDIEDEIACIVLEASPLLSDRDLLSIIERAGRGQRLTAISRRQGISEDLSDAIVTSDNRAAIATLLANPSARVREAALDELVSRAADVVEWHAPLVGRPELSRQSIETLAGFVAHSLLRRLERHPSLDGESAQKVAEVVRRRLEADAVGDEEAQTSREVCEARSLFESGQLDAEMLSDALIEGRRDFVVEGLSLLASKPRLFVEKILETGSAKGMTALSWQAGLTMRMATQVQCQLGGIPPQRVLYAQAGDAFPLSEEEMRWQLDFFESMVEKDKGRAAAQ